ncbi:MAG: sulfotransferase [Desulfobulbaceae bacterium]|uniref:Sulfotransferase n=1 Tax=Candidatus Desulfobia pelagia TaxID=2841692 RepID=A0A8J6NIG4_9BACT|nr:sulfotransferase [Candidatus Desulfobia pelagia]
MSLRNLKRNKSKKSRQSLSSQYGMDDLSGLLRTAQGYLQSGRLPEAEKMYTQIIAAFPASASAHIDLGALYHSQGDLEKAIKHYKQAIANDNNNLQALNNMAQGLQDYGDFDGAAAIYEKIIDIKPAPESWKSLGLIYSRMFKFDKAIAAYKEAVAVNPDDYDVHNKLGILHGKLGSLDLATRCFQDALRVKPDFSAARFSFAEVLEKNNRIEEAHQETCKGLTIDPDDIELQSLAAACERRLGKVRKAIDRLSQIDAAHLSAVNRRQLYFERGRCHDNNGEYEKAYSDFLSGNQAAQELSRKFNKESILEKLDSVKKQFQYNDIIPPVADSLCGRAPVFLVGFPRSGTTLLDQVLDSHSGVQTMEEANILEKMEENAAGPFDSYIDLWKNLTTVEIKKLQEQYYRGVDSCLDRQPETVLVDRNPYNTMCVSLAWRMFPDAKFILAVRHPLDVCLSCFMQDFQFNPANVNFFTLADAVHYYCKVMELWRLYSDRLPLNYTIVRYEDLVADLEGEARRLLDFVGVEWDPGVLKFYEHAKAKGQIKTASYHQVTRPIYRNAVDRWQHYGKFCEPFEKQMAPYMKYFGYC